MRNFVNVALFALASAVLTGCGSMNSMMNNQLQTVEMYHIIDVQTTASAEVVSEAIVKGLSRNTNSIVQNSPLQLGAITPEVPGRFKLVNPLELLGNSGVGAMLAMSNGAAGSAPVRIATCEDSVWNAKANRHISGSDNLNLYTCLYPYKGGYHLNVYAVFKKTSGGLMQLAREAAHSLVGTPEQWVTTTITDMLKAVQDTNASLTYVEGKPTLSTLAELNILKPPK